MYAPDCIKGVDGNYYLYYSVNSSGIIGIAKSSSPKGPFEFYSYVKYKNGEILGKRKGDCLQFLLMMKMYIYILDFAHLL